MLNICPDILSWGVAFLPLELLGKRDQGERSVRSQVVPNNSQEGSRDPRVMHQPHISEQRALGGDLLTESLGFSTRLVFVGKSQPGSWRRQPFWHVSSGGGGQGWAEREKFKAAAEIFCPCSVMSYRT